MDDASFEELLRIQNRMAGLVAREAEVDSKIKVLSIIDSITGNKKKKIQTEQILIECQSEGMSETEAVSTIDKLKVDGLLLESEPGFVART